jgi:hypothetical protein
VTDDDRQRLAELDITLSGRTYFEGRPERTDEFLRRLLSEAHEEIVCMRPDREAAIREMAEGDTFGQALLLVSRAKSRSPQRDLSFSEVRQWPDLEPPEEALRIWAGFAEQGSGGLNILEDWRNEGRRLIDAYLSIVRRVDSDG